MDTSNGLGAFGAGIKFKFLETLFLHSTVEECVCVLI